MESYMTSYDDIERYISDMFVALIGEDGIQFGFSEDQSSWAIIERQMRAPMPDVTSVITFRLDNYNAWRSQRYGSNSMGYDKYGRERICELRTFDCCVNIMSKNRGCAFDAARFVIANLQNNRYNTFIEQRGRLLGIEDISTIRDLSSLENGTWTERVYFEIRMNFKEILTINNHTLFVKVPETLGDLAQSVDVTAEVKK